MTYSCASCVSIWFEKSFCWWVVVPHVSGCCQSAAGSREVSACLPAASPCCAGGAGAGGKRWAWGNHHEDPGKWEAGGAKGGCRGFWQEPFLLGRFCQQARVWHGATTVPFCPVLVSSSHASSSRLGVPDCSVAGSETHGTVPAPYGSHALSPLAFLHWQWWQVALTAP